MVHQPKPDGPGCGRADAADFPAAVLRPDSSAPTGTKNFFEAILEFLRIEVFRPALKEHTDKFVPFLWTVFFFILFCNVLGCLPIPEIVGVATMGHLQHIGGTATGSISTTATLAVIAFFFIHFHGIDTLARADGRHVWSARPSPGTHQQRQVPARGDD